MPENPIPDEIMREAGKALGSPDFTREMLQVRVARALMAERERAASIVGDNEEVVNLKSSKRSLHPRTDGNLVGLAYAAAILNPSEKNNG